MWQFLVEVIIRTGDLALVAVALSSVYGLVRFPNVALVQYATAGAAVTLLLTATGIPLLVAIVLAALLTGGIAVALNAFVFNRLLRSGSAMAMIGSLAVSMMFVSAFMLAIGTRPQRLDIPIEPPLDILGGMVTRVQLWTTGSSLLLLVLFAMLLFWTDIGRQVRATSNNEMLAKATGIDTDRVKLLVVFLSGVLAALGGIALGVRGEVGMQIGNDLLLPVFAAAVLGGLGNPMGALAGAALIAVAETFVTNVNFGPLFGSDLLFLPIGYVTAASFAILVLALLLRPHGLFVREANRV